MSVTLSPSFAAESGPLARARVLFDLGRYREVLDILRPHLRDEEDPVSAYALCSSSLRVLGDFAGARNLAQEGLAHYPQDSVLHMELARSLLGLSLNQSALAEARQAVALGSEWAEPHALESAVLLEMGRKLEAEASIRRALALNPNNPDFYHCLAWNLYRQNREKDALSAANTGLALDPNHAELLGILAQLEPRRSKKLDLLRTALRLNPRHEGYQYLHGLHTRLFLRDVALAVALTVFHVGVKYLAPADWYSHYKVFGGIAIWVVGIALLRFTREHFWLVAAFNAANIALGIAPGDSAIAWAKLIEFDGLKLLSKALAVLLMAYIGTFIMRLLRIMMQLPFGSAKELFQGFRNARHSGVEATFLHELVRSRNAWFNLAGCLPLLVVPFLAPSWEVLGEYLFLAQPLLLYFAGQLWLPKEQKIDLGGAVMLHGLPLVFLAASHGIPSPTLLGAMLMSLMLALLGLATADLLRRIA